MLSAQCSVLSAQPSSACSPCSPWTTTRFRPRALRLVERRIRQREQRLRTEAPRRDSPRGPGDGGRNRSQLRSPWAYRRLACKVGSAIIRSGLADHHRRPHHCRPGQCRTPSAPGARDIGLANPFRRRAAVSMSTWSPTMTIRIIHLRPKWSTSTMRTDRARFFRRASLSLALGEREKWRRV